MHGLILFCHDCVIPGAGRGDWAIAPQGVQAIVDLGRAGYRIVLFCSHLGEDAAYDYAALNHHFRDLHAAVGRSGGQLHAILLREPDRTREGWLGAMARRFGAPSAEMVLLACTRSGASDLGEFPGRQYLIGEHPDAMFDGFSFPSLQGCVRALTLG